jgi:hypothetical protein
VRKYGKGRVFYSALGHQIDTYWNPTVLRHFLAGIQFALGDLAANATPKAPRAVPSSPTGSGPARPNRNETPHPRATDAPSRGIKFPISLSVHAMRLVPFRVDGRWLPAVTFGTWGVLRQSGIS